MNYEEFRNRLSTLEENTDYVSDKPAYFFLRTEDGTSILVSTDDYKTINIHTYDVSALAARKDFETLKKGMTVEEVVERVGLPIFHETSISWMAPFKFPIANGSTCEIQFLDDKVWRIKFV